MDKSTWSDNAQSDKVLSLLPGLCTADHTVTVIVQEIILPPFRETPPTILLLLLAFPGV
jgi:hypothetical protein